MTLPAFTRCLHILLVEDEAVIALTAEDMIEELGCTVTAHAASVAEALERVTAGAFDLALLDINLNGHMSTPVAEALQRAGKPFIFTTGYGSAGTQGAFPHAPVVAKPYTLTTLGRAIFDMARRSGLDS